ncbi:hypothetical protein, partial [Streptomyces sp. NPDC019224]|uniref:hypothetical protein n=1 Tax=Streptomyces sp. NPDC019224 TaxID=3154484 RepID=UPI0033E7E931
RINEDSRRRLGKHFAVYVRLYPPVHVDLYADKNAQIEVEVAEEEAVNELPTDAGAHVVAW